jgi:hypothetical protein
LVCDRGEPVANFDAALAVFTKADLERIEGVALISVSVGYHESFDGKFLWVLGVSEWSFRDGLACILRQHRLGIKAFHVAHAAVHE